MRPFLLLLSIVIFSACAEDRQYFDVQYAVFSDDTIRPESDFQIEVIGGDVFVYQTGLVDTNDNQIIDSLKISQEDLRYNGLDWEHIETFSIDQFPNVRFQLFRNICGFDCHQRLIVADGMGFIGRHGMYSTATELMTKFDSTEFNGTTKSELLEKLETWPHERNEKRATTKPKAN